jgi:hypothetical protein
MSSSNGDNLLDYVAHEFKLPPRDPAENDGSQHIGFWLDLAEGVMLASCRMVGKIVRLA